MSDKVCESLREFLDSFSYGSRNDLNFKFLKGLSDEEGAEFLQGLLRHVGDAADYGSAEKLVNYVTSAQRMAYSGSGGRYEYDDGPFATLDRPLNEVRLAVLSSSGHFVEGDDPEPFGVADMSQEEAIDRIGDFLKAPPQLSTIPIDTPNTRFRVRHGGYDIHGAGLDHNVALPIDAAKTLVDRHRIGSLHPNAYSFVGACSQLRMQNETGPAWADRFTREEIEAIVLVPV